MSAIGKVKRHVRWAALGRFCLFDVEPKMTMAGDRILITMEKSEFISYSRSLPRDRVQMYIFKSPHSYSNIQLLIKTKLPFTLTENF